MAIKKASTKTTRKPATKKPAAKKATTPRKVTRKATAKKAPAKKPAPKKPVKADPAYVSDTAWKDDGYSWKQSMKVYSLTGLDVRENWDNSGMTKGGASDIIQECIDDPKKARARLQKLAGVVVKKALPKPLTPEQKLQRELRKLNRRYSKTA